MEYCRHGDLHQYLSNRCSLLPAEAQQLTYQILEGLHHMHENDFAHRDLKPGVCGKQILSKHLVTSSEHPYQINATRGELVGSTCRLRYQ
jgi:serine/threonine protein kinase